MHGFDAATETDRIDHLGPLELPGVAEIQPVLGLLLLPAIDHRLAEQAVLVANAVTVGGDPQRRHAFHETGGQPPETTVAQGRIGLQQANALEVDIQTTEGLAGDVQQAQIAQAVVQQAADEKFQRQVIHPLLALAINLPGVVHPVVDHMITCRQGDGFEPVVVEGMVGVLAYRVGKLGQYSGTEGCHLSVTSKRFLRHGKSSGKLTI
ncbi:hypothetical protein D3C81_1458410 [compost metagenome]